MEDRRLRAWSEGQMLQSGHHHFQKGGAYAFMDAHGWLLMACCHEVAVLL